MPDSVNRVSGTEGASAGGNYSGGAFSGRKSKGGAPQSDVIEISQVARERSKGGTTKKSIMEWLKDLLS
jgi:hypothetical protein